MIKWKWMEEGKRIYFKWTRRSAIGWMNVEDGGRAKLN
jgi:hypothetical protein